MAELTWPTNSYPIDFELQESTSIVRGSNQYTHKIKSINTLNGLWNAAATIDKRSGDDAAATEVFVHGLRNGANTVAVPVFYRQTPQGTQTANTTLQTASLQGATSLALVSTTGLTLLAGDFLGIDNLLFRVTDNATAVANVLTVSVFPPARKAFSAGAFVQLQTPRVRMKLIEPAVPTWGRAGVLQPVTLTLQEHIA